MNEMELLSLDTGIATSRRKHRQAIGRPRSVVDGDHVTIGLRGGGTISGVVARRTSRGALVLSTKDGSVVVLECAASSVRKERRA